MSTTNSHPRSLQTQYRVLIVDDHPIVRLGLKELISEEPDFEVCGEAENVAEALRQVEAQQPDVVIVDISLDGENGIDLIERVKARFPSVKTLVSSIHDETLFAGRVLRAGAMGYVSKREAIRCIVDALRQVMRGEVYLSSRMASRLLHRAVVGQSLDQDPVETLSNRELEVFEMIGQGMTTLQIARRLSVSPKTVETHRKKIKMKLSLQNSTQLSRCAFQWVQEKR
jgi:DNA-binding NarL/FixJ family response regulator